MIDDAAILQGVLRFDEQALATAYDCYSPGLYRYAWRLLGETNLAEECVSETFSRLLIALRNGHGPRQYLKAYLYRVAHNWITDYYRNLQPEIELFDHLPADPEDDPASLAQRAVIIDDVRHALAQLTPEQRQVIMLKYLEGWENQEVAQALEKPVGAVKALHHRAVAALKRCLANELQE